MSDFISNMFRPQQNTQMVQPTPEELEKMKAVAGLASGKPLDKETARVALNLPLGKTSQAQIANKEMQTSSPSVGNVAPGKPLPKPVLGQVASPSVGEIPGILDVPGKLPDKSTSAPYWNSTGAAEPVQLTGANRFNGPNAPAKIPITPGNMFKPGPMAAVPNARPLEALPIPEIKSIKTPAIDATGPVPVISETLKEVHPQIEKKLDTPIPPEQAKKSLTAMEQFLSSNPDGFTLANILDAVGVSMSAYAGTQRKTALQTRKEAQLQLAAQQTLAEKGQEYARELKGMDVSNQIDQDQRQYAQQRAMLQEQLAGAKANNQANNAASLSSQLAILDADHNFKMQESANQWNPDMASLKYTQGGK